MLAEIDVVESTLQGLSFEEFVENQQALRVVLYSLAVIGEAVASILDTLESLSANIPWRDIRGMRNAVIHEYFQVDLEIIWRTAQSDLPTLKIARQQILDELTR